MNKHLKKGLSILIVIFSLCLATSALAKVYGPAKPYFAGFYGGLGAGVVSATADVKDHYSVANPTGLWINRNLDLQKDGFNGNAFMGFGKTLKTAYYLGLEAFANIFNPKMEGSFTAQNILILSTKVKNPYSFGGDIRFGYLILPRLMFYALFGLDYAKFAVKTKYSDIDTGSPGVMDNNFNKWKMGYMPGVGIELGLCNHLSLRAQYTYTFYPTFSQSKTEVRPENRNELWTLRTKVKPSRGVFTLMLSWLFN